MSDANETVLPKGWGSTHSGPAANVQYTAVLVDGHTSVRDLNGYYKDGWTPYAESKMQNATLVTLVRAKS